MSSLYEFVEGRVTDKYTVHSYLHFYDLLFTSLKDRPVKILEIGTAYGQSLKLWAEYFTKAEIIGIEANLNNSYCQAYGEIANRVNVIWKDAYTEETLNMFQDGYFDIIIDDGPHNVESQCYSAKHWFKKLNKSGTLVIEDVQDPERHLPLITNSLVNRAEVSCIGCYDYRNNKNRYDDYIITITRRGDSQFTDTKKI